MKVITLQRAFEKSTSLQFLLPKYSKTINYVVIRTELNSIFGHGVILMHAVLAALAYQHGHSSVFHLEILPCIHCPDEFCNPKGNAVWNSLSQ